ncbi:MAG: hypothetical protein KC766_08950, partial [Myxococcales bacterium]|nr:hypothetical protein [Myxococcales bacterium]
PEPVAVGAPERGSKPEALPLRSPPLASIGCGSRRCEAGSQICCGFGGEYTCAPMAELVEPPPGMPGEMRYERIGESCQDARVGDYSLDAIKLCDDSNDCRDGEVCCSVWHGSGNTLLACVPEAPSGKLACDFTERCAGATCRTANTECVGGTCRLKGRRVSCAGKTCGGATPVCCARDPSAPPRCEASCQATADTERAYEFECSSSRGCPSGATCQSGLFGSFCSRTVDTGNAVVLCEGDDDCPGDLCESLGVKATPTCSPDGREANMGWCHCDP